MGIICPNIMPTATSGQKEGQTTTDANPSHAVLAKVPGLATKSCISKTGVQHPKSP